MSGAQLSSPSVSSGQDVAAVAGPHGVPGAVCSPGSLSDVPSSVVTEELLVSSRRQCSYEDSFNSNVFIGGCRRRGGCLGSLFRCLLPLSCCTLMFALGVARLSSRSHGSRCLVSGGAESPYQCPGDEGSHSGLKYLSGSCFRPVSCSDERQHHGCHLQEGVEGWGGGVA